MIVAGIHAGHQIGPELARAIADRVIQAHAGVLKHTTLYVVHELNPDGIAFRAESGYPWSSFGGIPRPGDADHDGRIGEDSADDLNGDGWITWMRVADPAPESGLVAEWIADPDEPRLMRKPDAMAGELPKYALLLEGFDDDQDGKFNEDGLGGSAGSGVDLDRNFPALWPELKDGAGVVPLSESESRALADWMLAHDNIVAVLTIGPHDNLVKLPEVGKFEESGRVPIGIEEGDKAWYEKVGERYRELTGAKNAEAVDRKGSLHHWAYAHFGAYSFATPGWYRPDAEEPAEGGSGGAAAGTEDTGADEPEGPEVVDVGGVKVEMTPEGVRRAFEAMQGMSEAEGAAMRAAVGALDAGVRDRMFAMMSGEGGAPARPRSSTPSPKKQGDEAERKWLQYVDEHGGYGFVPWAEIEHPQLGRVEIGGLEPGLPLRPATDDWREGIDAHATFVSELLGQLPQLRVEAPSASAVGPGIWRIRLRAFNDGELPLKSAIGVKIRRTNPVVALLHIAEENLVNGSKVVRWESIEGHGAHAEAEWWVLAEDGATLTLDVRSVYGEQTFSIELGGAQ